MIVYELRCRKGHTFEAWFRDSGAYDDQSRAGKVACPTCGTRKVEKAPMAPRVGRSGERDPAQAETAAAGRALRAMRELRRQIEENFDYVGAGFAEEARKIHYGETDAHNIYGEASDEEASVLREEGVPFGRVPWPARQDS